MMRCCYFIRCYQSHIQANLIVDLVLGSCSCLSQSIIDIVLEDIWALFPITFLLGFPVFAFIHISDCLVKRIHLAVKPDRFVTFTWLSCNKSKPRIHLYSHIFWASRVLRDVAQLFQQLLSTNTPVKNIETWA